MNAASGTPACRRRRENAYVALAFSICDLTGVVANSSVPIVLLGHTEPDP